MMRIRNRSSGHTKNEGSTESSGRRRQQSKSYGGRTDEGTIDA